MEEQSKNEILEAIKSFADDVQEQFNGVNGEIGGIKSDLSSLKSDVTQLKTDVAYLKATSVTKDYLDEKMADLRGDLVVLVRKEDTKMLTLVKKLKEKKVLNNTDVEEIMSMEPFPKLSASQL